MSTRGRIRTCARSINKRREDCSNERSRDDGCDVDERKTGEGAYNNGGCENYGSERREDFTNQRHKNSEYMHGECEKGEDAHFSEDRGDYTNTSHEEGDASKGDTISTNEHVNGIDMHGEDSIGTGCGTTTDGTVTVSDTLKMLRALCHAAEKNTDNLSSDVAPLLHGSRTDARPHV